MAGMDRDGSVSVVARTMSIRSVRAQWAVASRPVRAISSPALLNYSEFAPIGLRNPDSTSNCPLSLVAILRASPGV
jgi:hypothetical protein